MVHAVKTQATSSTASGLPAGVASTVIAKAITARNPRARYTVGREAKLTRLMQLLPDRTVDRILSAALRPHYPEKDEHYEFATVPK
ncbi:hypothetical protein TUM20983_55380 [Mycobacterium antarcticum]|uniref:hypothetical protein n=1 Tax=Mycolicibacterium sp. TUM20983 TaxID=3023369 RepID=UPI002387383C|nr:hypothetical protein [Mycolicibacterium sp. TUM20983]GLP78428.1 hypothetical protein TUM20983_55380 [Mycolicibacterium sp. TUM20983]